VSCGASGRDGPRLREVLPALATLLAVACAAVAGLALVSRTFGGRASALLLVPLTVVAVVVRRRSRRPARRRGGYYTAEELAELDMSALVVAVARMLRRDGRRALVGMVGQDGAGWLVLSMAASTASRARAALAIMTWRFHAR
jgi:hypothetical protein